MNEVYNRIVDETDTSKQQPDESCPRELLEMFSHLTTDEVCREWWESGGDYERTLGSLSDRSLAYELANTECNNSLSEVTSRTATMALEVSHAPVRQRGRRKYVKAELSEPHGASESASTWPLDTDRVQRPHKNAWKMAQRDLDEVHVLTKIPISRLQSLWHTQKGSLPRVLEELARTYHMFTLHTDPLNDSLISREANELCECFPSLTREIAVGFCRLTAPSILAAHNLALIYVNSLTTSFSDKEKEGNFMDALHVSSSIVDKTHREVDLDNLLSTNLPKGVEAQASVDQRVERLTTCAQGISTSYQLARENAQRYYRKSRSNRLYTGAAAYYSMVAQDMSKKIRQVEDRNAEAIAESILRECASRESGAWTIDLHGLSVQQGVKVVLHVLEAWIEHCAGRKGPPSIKDKDNGLHIITGRGLHSKNRIPKLLKAVQCLLDRQGCTYSTQHGIINVIAVNKLD